MVVDRRYYSIRTGKRANKYGLSLLKQLFLATFNAFDEKGYFQEAMGCHCVDAGYVPGNLGRDIGAFCARKLRKEGLWPIAEYIETYSEEDVFDVIELLHDSVSKPLEGYYHNFSDCGWHYNSFDQEAGRTEYRTEINTFLCDYDIGYRLNDSGEILALPDRGMERLVNANLPTYDPENIELRVEAAKTRYLRHGASLDDRRDALRELASVLEFLRPRFEKLVTKKDDGTLFQIANDFGVRHHNDRQKTEYNRKIWYSWMYYFYLASIHAVLRLIEENRGKEQSPGEK